MPSRLEVEGVFEHEEERHVEQSHCESAGRSGAHRYHRSWRRRPSDSPGVPKIDLALTLGTPSFTEVVEAIADDMVIEKS